MGNRGCLHDAQGRITKSSARKAWVTCLLDFKGRHRQIMAPGQYTELFFLDEATALAAGHRPCGTCQKSRYEIFKQLWVKANTELLPGKGATIQEIDECLHAERRSSAVEGVGWTAILGDLPDGTFILVEDDPMQPYLIWASRLHPWHAGGYGPSMGINLAEGVTVITPHSVVNALAEGYFPQVHSTVTGAPPKKPEPREPKEKSKTRSRPGTPTSVSQEQRSEASHPVKSSATAHRLYKLSKTPAGKDLYTYFAAILRVTGMDGGAVYPLQKFLGNFSGHLKAGRIEKIDDGYKLTPQGMDYFSDRYKPGSRQHVEENEVQAVIKMITEGGSGWSVLE